MIRQEKMTVVKQAEIATNIFELTLQGQLDIIHPTKGSSQK